MPWITHLLFVDFVVICVRTCEEVGEGLGVNTCNVNKHVIKYPRLQPATRVSPSIKPAQYIIDPVTVCVFACCSLNVLLSKYIYLNKKIVKVNLQ